MEQVELSYLEVPHDCTELLNDMDFGQVDLAVFDMHGLPIEW